MRQSSLILDPRITHYRRKRYPSVLTYYFLPGKHLIQITMRGIFVGWFHEIVESCGLRTEEVALWNCGRCFEFSARVDCRLKRYIECALSALKLYAMCGSRIHRYHCILLGQSIHTSGVIVIYVFLYFESLFLFYALVDIVQLCLALIVIVISQNSEQKKYGYFSDYQHGKRFS